MRIIEHNIDEIKDIIMKSDYNINMASSPIRDVLNRMLIGTKLEIDGYYSPDGILQSIYEKKSPDMWSMTWRIKNGTIYWKVDQCMDSTVSDIFNDVCAEN